jgi:hypothetical protein
MARLRDRWRVLSTFWTLPHEAPHLDGGSHTERLYTHFRMRAAAGVVAFHGRMADIADRSKPQELLR